MFRRDEEPHPLVVGEWVDGGFCRKQRLDGDLGCFIA